MRPKLEKDAEMNTRMIYTRNDGWQEAYCYEVDAKKTIRRWAVDAVSALHSVASQYGWRVGAHTVDAQTRGTLCAEAYIASQKAGTFFATATLVGNLEDS